MIIKTIHHISLIISNTLQAKKFYCSLLGLTPAKRPNLDFPGIWLQLGNRQLHLLELENPDPITGRPGHPGHDRHIALSVTGIEGYIEILEVAHIPFTKSQSGRNAIFFRDPDGNGIEIIDTVEPDRAINNNRGIHMSKESKIKILKQEIKSRKAKISKQNKKLRKAKKALKKIS